MAQSDQDLTIRSQSPAVYRAKHKIRIITAASLYDGHDASINIMRRILVASGAEVIHLGHNRSVAEVVETAIQEDAQAIAVSSYQGGHLEYFKYMLDLLKDRQASHIKVFGGGGGVISEEEIQILHEYGVCRIFSVADGVKMGLQGMINYILEHSDFDPLARTISLNGDALGFDTLARCITAVEQEANEIVKVDQQQLTIHGVASSIQPAKTPVIGITGTGGAGKSSITDEMVLRLREWNPTIRIGIISVDPSKKKTGGALLGDRIRMNSIYHPQTFMRSMATRSDNKATTSCLAEVIQLCQFAKFDVIVVETSGIGQSDTEITQYADLTIYVMTAEYGAATQLEKINMLDYADLVLINKFERMGSKDALKAVRKQYRRNHHLWDTEEAQLPIYPTMASSFNDEGMNRVVSKVIQALNQGFTMDWQVTLSVPSEADPDPMITTLIPGARQRHLSEIAETVEHYHDWVSQQVERVRQWEASSITLQRCSTPTAQNKQINEVFINTLAEIVEQDTKNIDPECFDQMHGWDAIAASYRTETANNGTTPKDYESISGLRIPKVAVPKFTNRADLLQFILKEHLPGQFPFTAGVFPFKRAEEDPARMFAGEGTPERTNRRFHFISKNMPAKRLSTAFDSVTLYGQDPALRPDIYGKIGNAGVSICTLDDMKRLYSGFQLNHPSNSVSMTINGPAPMILAMFMNTAIDQEVERHLKAQGLWESTQKHICEKFDERGLIQPRYAGQLPEGHDGFGLGLLGVSGDEVVDRSTYELIKASTLKTIRGTVQADILKEDQAQNTCIFSTNFALKMMGDIQTYFSSNKVRHYYSISISGYHIAEAGANPITQAAFTLANGFTYVEYFLSRGLSIDDFAHNLSFFFSNGLDPEYAVIGRVARRIWAIAMKQRYGASERSQKLKYHIQTSGRSLHAQEIQFNDIRTTLQALLAIYDNCNSLHTNAYDEALTTPTEESVRRALAIQLIINKELGITKNENMLQGSFIIEELTDLVERSILQEFHRLSERGGVLGAMETMYQRNKIQDESLHYETLKHNGSLPIIGVNTFLDLQDKVEAQAEQELIRSSSQEKQQQIDHLKEFQLRNASRTTSALNALKATAARDGNLFEAFMETVKYASLGQITDTLYAIGGQYRRNM